MIEDGVTGRDCSEAFERAYIAIDLLNIPPQGDLDGEGKLEVALQAAETITNSTDSGLEKVLPHSIKIGMFLTELDDFDDEQQERARISLGEMLARTTGLSDQEDQIELEQDPSSQWIVPAPLPETGKSLADTLKDLEVFMRECVGEAVEILDFWSRTSEEFGDISRMVLALAKEDDPEQAAYNIAFINTALADVALRQSLYREDEPYEAVITVIDSLITRQLENLPTGGLDQLAGAETESSFDSEYIKKNEARFFRKINTIKRFLDEGAISTPSIRVYLSYYHDNLIAREALIAYRDGHDDYLARLPDYLNEEVAAVWNDVVSQLNGDVTE